MKKIVFKATRNTVTADAYVPHAIYALNEAIIDELGGEIVKGVGEFRAKFPTTSLAKEFVELAVTQISKREYNAARKTEPKAVVTKSASTPKSGKGKAKSKKNDYIVLTDDNGNEYRLPLSALGIAPEKGKGSTTKGGKKETTKTKSTQKSGKATKGKGSTKRVDSDLWHEKYEELLDSPTKAKRILRNAGVDIPKSETHLAYLATNEFFGATKEKPASGKGKAKAKPVAKKATTKGKGKAKTTTTKKSTTTRKSGSKTTKKGRK